MTNMARYSVCIATYNGGRFIKQQLLSILPQLGEHDEIIITDDSSTDNTVTLIQELGDPRIKIYPGQRFGNPTYNFEKCLSKARGEIVFLADQDDIWLHDKVAVVERAFDDGDCCIVVSDAVVVDEGLRTLHDSFHSERNSGPGLLKNLVKNSYLGCTMAVRRSVLEKALPFPRNIPMHDIWLGLVGEVFCRPVFIDNKLVLYRRHEHTVTTGRRATVVRMLAWRFSLIVGLGLRYIRVKVYGR